MSDFGETKRATLLRWAVAFTVISAIHAGAVAWAYRTPPEDDYESQTGGAFVLELSQVTASPDEDPSVAVGEHSEQVAAVAASAPQVASVAKPTPDEQQIVPEAPVPPPEDALERKPDKQPPDETKQPESSAQKANDAPQVAPREASNAAAPERIENATKKADVPSGQNVGLSRVDRVAIQNWQRDFALHIKKHKRYPHEAQEMRIQGTARVLFAMDRTGRVLNASISKSSGSPLLDKAAVDLLNRASPLPAPPASMPGENIVYNLPVEFLPK